VGDYFSQIRSSKALDTATIRRSQLGVRQTMVYDKPSVLYSYAATAFFLHLPLETETAGITVSVQPDCR
jgi:hypothetical protein